MSRARYWTRTTCTWPWHVNRKNAPGELPFLQAFHTQFVALWRAEARLIFNLARPRTVYKKLEEEKFSRRVPSVNMPRSRVRALARDKPSYKIYPCLSTTPNRLRRLGAPRILRSYTFFVVFSILNIITAWSHITCLNPLILMNHKWARPSPRLYLKNDRISRRLRVILTCLRPPYEAAWKKRKH
jgi:hypothetical protein